MTVVFGELNFKGSEDIRVGQRSWWEYGRDKISAGAEDLHS